MAVSYQKFPCPYFGGKAKATPVLWSLLGDPHHFVSGFAGTWAEGLARPHPCNRPSHSETVSDTDGLMVNALRALQWHPEATAEAASWYVSELDKQARQIAVLKWLDEKAVDLLAGSYTWCDPQMAGMWLYGMSTQIGAFDGRGSWTADPVTGRIVKVQEQGQPGATRDLLHLGNDGRGVCHGVLREPGISRDRPHVSDNGQGVHHAGLREPGVGDDSDFHPMTMPELRRWFRWLSARLRHVRIVNGDWHRVCTPGARLTLGVRQGHGHCAVFLDPPYAMASRDPTLYRHESDDALHARIVRWALEDAGRDSKTRVVIAGFAGAYPALEAAGWSVHEWYTPGFLHGGYGNMNGTSQQAQERLWASPSCIPAADRQLALFSGDPLTSLP